MLDLVFDAEAASASRYVLDVGTVAQATRRETAAIAGRLRSTIPA